MRLVPVFLLCLFVSCSDDETPTGTIDPNDPSIILWNGPDINFTKENNTDPTLEENQDRITDNVWITRGNSGGQIYNAVLETNADKNASPRGTEWALGTLADLENLNFQPFRAAVGEPKDVEGLDLVVHLIEDNIYLELKFTSWSQGMAGGFSYERSTE